MFFYGISTNPQLNGARQDRADTLTRFGFQVAFNFVLETDSRLRMSKLLHHSLSITSINISISTTACKSLQIISASVLLAGTFASEIGDIINLVSDIINLEAEDNSANANQFLWASRRQGWGGGGFTTALISFAKLRCAREQLIELNVSERCGLLGFFFHTHM